MYQKIKDIRNSVCDEHWFATGIISFIISFIIICCSFTINNWWGDFFYPYPEQEYQNLEDEAEKMILNHNFETDYRFTINDYDSESNDFEMELHGDKATIEIEVENYGESNQSYEVKRHSETQKKENFDGIVRVMVVTSLLAMSLYISIFIFSNILLFIASVINKIITRKNKK